MIVEAAIREDEAERGVAPSPKKCIAFAFSKYAAGFDYAAGHVPVEEVDGHTCIAASSLHRAMESLSSGSASKWENREWERIREIDRLFDSDPKLQKITESLLGEKYFV